MSSTTSLSQVIGRIRTEEAKEDIDQICKELATVAAGLAIAANHQAARTVQCQIIRLRTLEARL